MKQSIVHVALVVKDYEDLYGNLWDLLELNKDHPISARSV
jgi:hypothetical protein